MVDSSKKRLTWVLVLLSNLLVAGLAFMVARWPASGGIEIQPPQATPLPTPTRTPAPLRVYVSGAVNTPGVYTLPPNSITEDALSAAGGLTTDAESGAVNLAAPLRDGEQLHIPARGEPTPSSPPTAEPASSAPSGPVNINTATVEELDTLPGIGPTYAARIVQYREGNGPFRTVDALLLVQGIGPATLEKLRPFVTVE
jgi:competence protein ComEA